MLIGHYGPALLLHRARPRVPLWVLFVGVQAVDVLWAAFILGGVEHARIVPGFTESNALDLYDMPYTHSLAATFAWALLAGGAWAALRRGPERVAEGVVVGLAVASHFACDFLVHVGDLPILGNSSEKLGLGLWRHRELALAVELAVFAFPAIAWALASWQPAAGGRRRLAFLAVMAALLVASFYIPTPPTPWAMAFTSLFTYAAFGRYAAWAAPLEATTRDARRETTQPAG